MQDPKAWQRRRIWPRPDAALRLGSVCSKAAPAFGYFPGKPLVSERARIGYHDLR